MRFSASDVGRSKYTFSAAIVQPDHPVTRGLPGAANEPPRWSRWFRLVDARPIQGASFPITWAHLADGFWSASHVPSSFSICAQFAHTASPTARGSSRTPGMGGAVKAGELDPAFAIFSLFKQRVEQRVSYARGLLTQDIFDFSGDDRWYYDREDAPWAATDAEVEQLWKQSVRNDWLRLKLAGKDPDAIRKTLDDARAILIGQSVGNFNGLLNQARKVFADRDDKCRVVWIADLMPNEVAETIAEMIQQGLSRMKRTLEGIPTAD